MFNSLAGRTALITGASHGIGRAMAEVFGREGCNLILIARKQDPLNELADKLRANGVKVCAASADVSCLEEMQAAASLGERLYGGIDIVLANAGIFPQTSLEQISPAELAQVLDTNVKGCFYTVQACLPCLKHSKHGRVILTSSITGPITGYPGWAHYGASKAAQLGFMHTAAIELAPWGITVNAVSPGNVISDGLVELGEDYIAKMAQCVPSGKLGTVYDIANAALFLAADEAGYISGHNLVIDGAQTLPESPAALEELRASL